MMVINNTTSRQRILLVAITLFLLALGGCRLGVEEDLSQPQVEVDLDEILERGKLVALTGYDFTSYFIYKGQPMGFEYELLKNFTAQLGVELEMVVVRNLDSLFEELNKGTGDVVAYNLTITAERQKKVLFANHHSEVRQVLVQRLPENWQKMPQYKIDQQLLRSPVDLIGKTIYVRRGSAYYERLVNLEKEIGGDIDIVEVPGDVTTEELIRQVSAGEIDYTIADENIAWIASGYYTNIDTRLAISLRQRIAWCVRKNSPKLRDAINDWLAQIKREPTFNIIYNKYYRNRAFFRKRLEILTLNNGITQISEYDSLIRKYAKTINWDWRLLAAQIYKESKFNPKAKSWMGATGLMQITPVLAEQYGVTNLYDPEENIQAGVRHLKWLSDYWAEIPDSLTRLKFILASYNVGLGHVLDARRLAEKYDEDPNDWEVVKKYLLNKSKPEYYNDEVVIHGYCRGEEPVRYVRDILYIYNHYKKFAPA